MIDITPKYSTTSTVKHPTICAKKKCLMTHNYTEWSLINITFHLFWYFSILLIIIWRDSVISTIGFYTGRKSLCIGSSVSNHQWWLKPSFKIKLYCYIKNYCILHKICNFGVDLLMKEMTLIFKTRALAFF